MYETLGSVPALSPEILVESNLVGEGFHDLVEGNKGNNLPAQLVGGSFRTATNFECAYHLDSTLSSVGMEQPQGEVNPNSEPWERPCCFPMMHLY